jgi:hypothetical protein
MNAYMYHMLLQAREGFWKSLQGGPVVANCPFCDADARQTGEDMITIGLTVPTNIRSALCMNCPLINLFNLKDLGILMEDCEDMGRHALQVYEEMGE